jgi:hypothetical protein
VKHIGEGLEDEKTVSTLFAQFGEGDFGGAAHPSYRCRRSQMLEMAR